MVVASHLLFEMEQATGGPQENDAFMVVASHLLFECTGRGLRFRQNRINCSYSGCSVYSGLVCEV
jgi:hypothetical protein